MRLFSNCVVNLCTKKVLIIYGDMIEVAARAILDEQQR